MRGRSEHDEEDAQSVRNAITLGDLVEIVTRYWLFLLKIDLYRRTMGEEAPQYLRLIETAKELQRGILPVLEDRSYLYSSVAMYPTSKLYLKPDAAAQWLESVQMDIDSRKITGIRKELEDAEASERKENASEKDDRPVEDRHQGCYLFDAEPPSKTFGIERKESPEAISAHSSNDNVLFGNPITN